MKLKKIQSFGDPFRELYSHVGYGQPRAKLIDKTIREFTKKRRAKSRS